MKERDFSNIPVTPDDSMRCMLNDGRITLQRYMIWLMTDRSWESVAEIITQNIIDAADKN
ncbi:MAG TPA: hypothetical protein ENH82_03395 [bacterium]|nr:hypothetical protein [bacterium]